MRKFMIAALTVVLVPAAAAAQTVGARAITRDVFSQRPFPGEAARGIVEVPRRTTVIEVPQRAVEDGIVRERVGPVVERTVVERPVVRERVVVEEPAAPWWDVFARNRYGYYDDAYFDDNWFYDYYEVPRVTRGAARPGFRTGWLYDLTAERGLFNF